MASAALSPALDAEREVAEYLAADRAKSLLRFVTCGSVDDGKSTLIGRLLYDSKQLFQDQLAALESDSRRFGTQGDRLDFALLVDGLADEREQGITIDVAYRFFATDARKFIVADSPGHEQYTRNMVTAASTADLAIILIDARRGVLSQTRRHSHIVRLLGVRNVVLAVNKMDLVDHAQDRFDAIVDDYADFAAASGIHAFMPIPIAALAGDNVSGRSAAMSWYEGPTLIEALERAPTGGAALAAGFAMPVQWVNRPNLDFRGFSGTIAEGRVAVGDAVTVLPTGRRSRIERIVTFDGELSAAQAGQAVTLTLADQVECARGATLASPAALPDVGNAITADLVWLDDTAFDAARRYLLKAGTQTVPARLDAIERMVAIDAGDDTGSPALTTNAIAVVRLKLDAPIVALPYERSRALGGFVLIDRESNATVAAGMIRGVSTESGAARRGATGTIYTLATTDQGDAGRLARLLEDGGAAVAVLDHARLAQRLCADLDADDTVGFWRRAAAAADLIAATGVSVVLALDRPATEPIVGVGIDHAGIDAIGGDWVI